MKIYTKTGDNGTTSLVGGTRISKAEIKIETYGTVDELNSWIGLIAEQSINQNRKHILKEIQDRLFTIGSDLASEPEIVEKRQIPDLLEEDIVFLEQQIDEMDSDLPPLRAFILPGGNQAVAFTHVGRTVCRRAERLCIRLNEREAVNPLIIRYLNRLSDYLFVLSRKMCHESGAEEITWQSRKNQ